MPDLATVAGNVAAINHELDLLAPRVARIERMVERICTSLDIPIDRSDPPPAFRPILDSLREEDAKLQRADAEITGQMKAVSAQQATMATELHETRVDVRFGLIKGIPRLAKVGAALVTVLGVLAALASQIWSVVHGH